MKSLKIKYSKHTPDGVRDEEEYEFYLSEKGLQQMELLDSFEEKDVGVYFGPLLPERWEKLSFDERAQYVSNHTFDIALDSLYFKNGAEASKNDVDVLIKFSEITGLSIWGRELDLSDVEKISTLQNLTNLVLCGSQFSDEIVDVISQIKNLRMLDLQVTAITKHGEKRLRSIMPERCQIWCP